jgi:WD40 repeat protein
MPCRLPLAFATLLALGPVTPARAADPPPAEGGPADVYGDPLPDGAVGRLGTVRLRHAGSVDAMAFSPDGKLVASAGTWNAAVWDVQTGREVARFRGNIQGTALAFSADGKTLLAGGREGVVRHWDVATGTLRRESKQDTEGFFQASETAFSPDAKLLALTDHGGKGRLVDSDTGKCVARLSREQAIQSIAVAPGGRRVATGGQDEAVHVWDAAEGKELRTLPGQGGWVNDVCFSPDGRKLAASSPKRLRVWDDAGGKLLIDAAGEGGTPAFAPDGRTLAVGRGGTVRLWDVETGRPLRDLKMPGGGPAFSLGFSLAFSPEGRRLACSRDSTIVLWDLNTGKPLHDFPGHRLGVVSLAWSPGCKSLATGGNDNTLFAWDVASRKPRFSVAHNDPVLCAAYSPDGRTIATGEGTNGPTDREARVRLVDAATGRAVRDFYAHLNSVGSLAYSPDGRTLATSGMDARVRLWDAVTGRKRFQFRVPDTPKKRLSFTPDGRALVAEEPETGRGPVWRSGWRVSTGERLGDAALPAPRHLGPTRYYPNHGPTAAAPDGKVWAEGNGDGFELYEAGADHPFAHFTGHAGGVTALEFAPDGRTLATGSWDTTVLLWDVARVRLIGHWAGLDGDDPARAARALAAAPGAAAFLRDTLRRAAAREAPYARAVDSLDADRFEAREAAARELQQAGPDAALALGLAAEGRPSAEVRRRARQALDRLAAGASPGAPQKGGSATSPRERFRPEDALRQAAGLDVVRVDLTPASVRRGLDVLGRMDTPEAKGALRALAAGPPEASVTRAARAALDHPPARSP